MLDSYRFVDLTHSIHPEVPSWTGACGFESEIKMDYDQGVRVMKYTCHAGIGTHMDSPSHFYPNTANIADIPIEDLIVPACIIDVSAKMHADYMIDPKDLSDYEEQHGKIPPKSLIIGYTGWSSHWPDAKAYRNEDADGQMHFPGFTASAAELLLERKCVGIGIDTLSPDGSNMEFPVHKHILGAGKYILENMANLEQMLQSGGYIIALPIKVKEGTEAAVRAIGLIPK